MPSNWNKGFTKDTNLSVRKISETMKRRRIDNFYVWRENVCELMQHLGFHPHRSQYQIQISRKEEVYRAIKVLGFRDYK